MLDTVRDTAQTAVAAIHPSDKRSWQYGASWAGYIGAGFLGTFVACRLTKWSVLKSTFCSVGALGLVDGITYRMRSNFREQESLKAANRFFDLIGEEKVGQWDGALHRLTFQMKNWAFEGVPESVRKAFKPASSSPTAPDSPPPRMVAPPVVYSWFNPAWIFEKVGLI